MSIAAQLEPLVRRQALAGVTRAGQIVSQRLDNVVPRRTGATARAQRSRTAAGSRVISFTVEYNPSKIANITNEGPRAHVIRPRRAKALRFVKGGRVIFARKVNWRPGPGVARNKGWFSRETTLPKWTAALRQVFQ